MCEHHHEHKNDNEEQENFPLIRIGFSILVCILAVVTHPVGWFGFGMFLVAYIIAGGDIILKAFKNILNKEIFDENFLMCVATLGAMTIKEYPEAVMVMILYQIGEYFQDKAVEKSRKSISELMDVRPDYANIEKNGKITQISPKEVNVDDIIIVKTGEKIPLDGVVIEGNASLDTSALTGESIPRDVGVNDFVYSGCINSNGMLRIKVEKKYEDSTVSKILELVEHAENKKTKTENFITKFAKIYTPIVVFAALILAILPPILLGQGFGMWVSRALTFLVISCPCALVISVPLGFFAGVGGASKNGILIKGSSYIEVLSKAKVAVFDKTGTLTQGVFSVVKVSPQNGLTEEELLNYASSAEKFSNHPIALSLKAANNTVANSVSDVEEIAGNGVRANVNGNIVLVGNSKLMDKFGIHYTLINDIGTVVYVASNGNYLGYIVISDKIKDGTIEAIKKLRANNVRTVMLTGDNNFTAKNVAEIIGIDEVYSQLLPENKVEKIEEIILKKPQGSSVIYVGDGINDAPVLTRADVGIAMGGLGADAAIEAADVVIMDDNPQKVPTVISISKSTLQIVKQNIIFAIGVKILFLLLGAIGFMSMWGAVFADVGVTLLAVLNSLRALRGRG